MYVPMLHDAQPTRLATATNKSSKLAQPQDLADSARLMPVERQTSRSVEATEPISRIFSEHSGLPVSQIRIHLFQNLGIAIAMGPCPTRWKPEQ